MKKLRALLLLIGYLNTACETFLEVEIPNSEPRLVVNTVLEPGSPVMVYVTSSKSVLEETEYEVIEDALVTISHNGILIPLQFVKDNEYWQNWGAYSTLAINPRPAEKYTIEVSHPAYKTATSTVTLPVPTVIKSFSHQIMPGQSSQDSWNPYPEVAFTLIFDDLPGMNFYEIDLLYEGEGEYTDHEGNTYETIYSQFTYLTTKNPAFEQTYRAEPGLLINDLLFEGKEAEVTFYTNLPTAIDLDLTVYLREINEEAYRYHVSANLQQENRGDPLSQPVQVISNVQNGFGLVKARTSTFIKDEIFIPE